MKLIIAAPPRAAARRAARSPRRCSPPASPAPPTTGRTSRCSYINPFPAGGPTDMLSRIACQKLTELTGQQFIVENKGGSGGNVGADAIAKSAPDGYTIGLMSVASATPSPPTLYAKLPFNADKDFTPVTMLWSLPNLLIVRKSAAGQDGAGADRAGEGQPRQVSPTPRRARARRCI